MAADRLEKFEPAKMMNPDASRRENDASFDSSRLLRDASKKDL